MLEKVPKLAKDIVRNISRVLRDEINANTFGTDQAGDLFNFIHKRLWCVIKQQVGFVKEEDQFWFVRVADLWQLLKQFGQ